MDTILPRLSVVVCTYNGAKTIKKCLDSLVQQTTNKQLIEIIIVDNASTDNSKEIINWYCHDNNNVNYYFENRVGLSSARNTGFLKSKGSLIAYIDDDAYAEPDWCEKIISNFEKYTPQAVGGNVYPYYEKPKPFWFNDSLESIILGMKPTFLNGIRQKSGFCGSNMCFTREILTKYNGFNEEFGMKGEDVGLGEDLELFFRMSQNNEKLYFDPTMIVYHFVPKHKYDISYRIHRAKSNGVVISKLHKLSGGSPIQYSFIRFIYYLFNIPILFVKNLKIASIVLPIEKSITHFYSLRFSIFGF